MTSPEQEQPTYLTQHPRKKSFSLSEWLIEIVQSTISMAVEAHLFFAMMVSSAFVGALVWFLLFIFRVGFYFPLMVGVIVAIAVFRFLLNIKRQIFNDTTT
jgi:hypothetical protein